MPFVDHARGLQRFLIRRPSINESLVRLAVKHENGSLDLRHVGRHRRLTVERRHCVDVRAHPHGELIRHAAAVAEAGGAQPAGAVGSAAGALPAAPPAELPAAHPVAAQPPRKRPAKRQTPEQVAAQRDQVLAIVRGQPGIMRAAVARIAGIDLPTVKRRTDELLAAGAIDAAPLPGVRERGPGGGHGLFARMAQGGAPMS